LPFVIPWIVGGVLGLGLFIGGWATGSDIKDEAKDVMRTVRFMGLVLAVLAFFKWRKR